MADKSYLKFIAYLQIIGIVLVVLGHSFFLYPDGEHGKSLMLYRLLFNVRMPCFTFVSGFLMYYTSYALPGRERSAVGFTVNKLKRLLLPFLVLTLVTFIPRASMSGMAEDEITLSWHSLAEGLIYSDRMVIPYFWFLQMSFLLLVGTYLMMKLATLAQIPREAAVWALLAIFILLPVVGVSGTTFLSLNEVVRLGVYFMLGVLYCRYYEPVNRALRIGTPLSMAICGVVWVTLFLIGEGTDLARLGSVFGIAMLVSFARLLEERHITVLDHLRGTNYMIFLLSWYVNVAAQQVLSHFVTMPWWVHTALSLIGGIYVPVIIFRLMQRHRTSRISRLAAFLLGQKLDK